MVAVALITNQPTAGRPIGAPVADKAAVKGTYDADLKFAPEDSTDSFPSIFTAIQEQLGLKLKSQNMPLEMLVIEPVPARANG